MLLKVIDVGRLFFFCLPYVLASSSLSTSGISFPNPEPCTGNCSWVHDPSVLKYGNTWYRYSTNGNLAIATAPSLTGPWRYDGALLPSGSSITVGYGQQLWAPDVSLIHGTFYCFYAVALPESEASQIGVATSRNPGIGGWTDHGALNIPQSPRWNLIDPNLFQERPSAPFYLSFGSAWQDIFQTKLDPSLTKVLSGAPYNHLIYNSTHPVGSANASITEGSYQFWWYVGSHKYYYMFFSNGDCCQAENDLAAPGEEYKVYVCRSEVGPSGPFTDAQGKSCLTDNGGTLVLASHGDVYAPGGQGVVVDPSSWRPLMYYHYVNKSIGYDYSQYQFGYNYVDFSSGWPVLTS